ncbi:Xaa-Pro peptidase family protein [Pseudonocardia sp. KRD291]|uniref:M24 family metallopeptidase n=1 Tax=Pseudonocardia sp. KRD291 TaxID=2792007 RepID=UPI001C4A171C|nr:aminopeptidase P family protein [Pseudonocardia sp. KRD291]MBW0103510.1 aminopeptidase P family protein [Pseudonocardia sp. KRD291]
MAAPERRDALRVLLRADGLDAVLVTDLVGVRYLSGFTGSNAALVVSAAGPDGDVFCTDGRYTTQAAAEVGDVRTVVARACAAETARAVAPGTVLGFESDDLTVDAHAALVAAAPGRHLRPAPGLVARLRTVKDADEVEAVGAACAVADEALAGLLADGGLAAGRSELEVALDLETRMRRLGAAGPAFDTILAAGAHSAIPHHRPTGTELRRGDLVKLDFGALVRGYHSDMTRTFVLGPPADWQRELYDLVAAAHRAGCDALAPDVETRAVDAASRDVIVEAGFGEQFVHGLGHGVGLQIHEPPWLSARSNETVAAGQVLTVEPGVYLEGRGGVRIEDTLVVGADGARPLTATARELVEL